MKSRWLLEGTGAAVLLLMPYMVPLLLPWNIALYHHRLPMAHVAGGLLVDFAVIAAAATVVRGLLSLLPGWPRRVTVILLAILLSARLYFDVAPTVRGVLVRAAVTPGRWRIGTPALMSGIASCWDRYGGLLGAALLAGSAAVAILKPAWARAGVRSVQLGLAALAFCSFWIVPKLLQVALASPASHPLAAARAPEGPVAGERVVWVLFDELSHNLIFDHRAPGETFPHFDQLRSRSVSLDDVIPEEYYTDRVIPSLLAGRAILRIRSTLSGELYYLDPVRNKWTVYDPKESLLGEAYAGGWNPGVAGWYLPYCRTFAPVLVACSWRAGIDSMTVVERLGASEERSVIGDALVEGGALPDVFGRRNEGTRKALVAENIADYRSLMQSAAALIGNPEIHFVFIHLGVPHPPGFYDRRTHMLRVGGNYLDNLVLTDETLGVLEEEIGAGPEADKTTMVVSSDHSWRVPMWRPSGGKLQNGWTAEEEKVSGGRFETRPVFLVQFPWQEKGWDEQEAMPELVEHDIVAGILEGRIRTAEDLRALLPGMEEARSGKVDRGDAMGQ
jgi:hypothetical protein